MTSKNDPQTNRTNEHLEAMLYLLDDPALDREAFEARLADDAQLGEILAQAVTTFQALQAASFKPNGIAQGSVARRTSSVLNALPQWQFLSVLAASILLACFLGWQTHFEMRSGLADNGSNNVVLAWGDIQSAVLDHQGTREVSEFELENALAMSDSLPEMDVPEWLVIAAADTAEGFELDDRKVIIQ